jgi:hypothetical protein
MDPEPVLGTLLTATSAFRTRRVRTIAFGHRPTPESDECLRHRDARADRGPRAAADKRAGLSGW